MASFRERLAQLLGFSSRKPAPRRNYQKELEAAKKELAEAEAEAARKQKADAEYQLAEAKAEAELAELQRKKAEKALRGREAVMVTSDNGFFTERGRPVFAVLILLALLVLGVQRGWWNSMFCNNCGAATVLVSQPAKQVSPAKEHRQEARVSNKRGVRVINMTGKEIEFYAHLPHREPKYKGKIHDKPIFLECRNGDHVTYSFKGPDRYCKGPVTVDFTPGSTNEVEEIVLN